MADGIEVLQEVIRGMSENVGHMRVAVDNMTVELRKISVLEEKHSNHETALTRAFAAIKETEKALVDQAKANSKEHDGFKKAIWFTTGMACAVTVFWTLFGIYLTDTVRDNLRAISILQAHVQDKTIHVTPPHNEYIIKPTP